MSAVALEVARAALGEREAWLVGGAVRDQELGRTLTDIDVVVDGDPGEAARLIAVTARARGERAACFSLSERFGAWRVAMPAGGWQIDVEGMRGGSLAADLALRDFTVNAIAEPLRGGGPIDPLGGLEDLRAGRLRGAGPSAFADDPLRVLRLVRVAVELDLRPEDPTLAAARAQAAALAQISPERVFGELRRIVACDRAVAGLELMEDVGAVAAILPELRELRGVQQSRYHHLDVYDHTMEVLKQAIALTCGGTGEADAIAVGHCEPADGKAARGETATGEATGTETVIAPHGAAGQGVGVAAALGDEHAAAIAALLREPLADGLTRGDALRWGALLHDTAKPATRAVRPLDRRVTFLGHDVQGAQLARDVLGRMRTSVRLREHVSALVRWHLRLGFLVHQPQPLARESVFAYLRDCAPVEVDVTLLSVCDRLATRGARSERAIEAHMGIARAMLGDALRWREHGPPQPLLRGDELAAALGLAPGPRVGELLAELAEAQFAGRVTTREQALAFVKGLRMSAR